MNKQIITVLAASTPFLLASHAALAQGVEFSWEGEVEIGIESVLDSNVPGNEINDPFMTGELAGELAFSDSFAIFGGLTAEEMAGPGNSLGHMGLYVHELGLQFSAGSVTAQLGKVTPTFGTAWDDAAGYFASAIAEDYELTEALGGVAEADLGGAGVLALGVFYADDTILSESFGTNRGRNSTTAGGAGNTGELNNATLQWSKALDDTSFHIGGRYLSKGTGDVKDETGIVAGVGHSFAGSGMPLDVFAEVAFFDGFGGTADDALYATLSAGYTVGSTTYSAAYGYRDIDSVGDTNMFSIGIDHELESGITVGGALAFVDDAGTEETLLGASIIIPLGG